ncbi:hypothetical protein [Rhodoblastus sp.]|uniref:hypothetical protein n=1 Tax=Rhodoblastus sp. TaxID=1962975 RepID=UPI0025E5A7A4|nr:hypothetical protein [Rhodoblastus sp.]
MTPTFRRGSDFRAYVQDSLSAQGKPGGAERGWGPALRARIVAKMGGLLEGRPGAALGESLRQRAASAQSRVSALMASASALLHPKAETAERQEARQEAQIEAQVEAAEPVRARRAQARRTQENGGREPVEEPSRNRSTARKIDLELSRREIEAVQARLDARAAPRDHEEKWRADLAREYRREFHPIEAARAAPVAPGEDRTAADGAAAALFLAGKAAWRASLILEPVFRFLAAYSAAILKVAAVGLVVVGAGGLLAQWPGSDRSEETFAPASQPAQPGAQRAVWLEVPKPLRLFDLSAPSLAHEKRLYAARRHTTGGGREDALTFGEFAGAGPFFRLAIYRHGAEKTADAAFFVDMARRGAQLGLSLGRANVAQTQATRFGDFETAAMTMTEGGVTRDACRGFRFSAAQLGLTIAGFFCGADDEAASAGALACLVNRLDLISSGEDGALRDFFASAQARGARGCAEPASAPVKKRAEKTNQ